MYILAYDIGGTYIKFGRFTQAGELMESGRFPTARGDGLVPAVRRHAAAMAERHPIQGIAIGIPGLVRQGVVRAAVNLGLEDLPLVSLLEGALKVPVVLANDASLAALGEHRFGSAAGLDDFILVTIGTGIGTGIILGGQLFEGRHGAFGELGHTVVEPEGRLCSCGNHGCLEMYVSIKGLLANYQAHWGSAVTIEELLQSGAHRTGPVLDQAARPLGFALANAVTLLDLDQVLLGGGLAEVPELVERTAHWIDHFVLPLIKPVRVSKASLGNDAALYGAWHHFMTMRGRPRT